MTNVDRAARNTNMLWWHKKLMLIDHGAALYFHHIGVDYSERSRTPFTPIKSHVLLPFASMLKAVDDTFKRRLTVASLQSIVDAIPESWLSDPLYPDPAAHRAAYLAYLLDRLEASHIFVEEAQHARDLL